MGVYIVDRSKRKKELKIGERSYRLVARVVVPPQKDGRAALLRLEKGRSELRTPMLAKRAQPKLSLPVETVPEPLERETGASPTHHTLPLDQKVEHQRARIVVERLLGSPSATKATGYRPSLRLLRVGLAGVVVLLSTFCGFASSPDRTPPAILSLSLAETPNPDHTLTLSARLASGQPDRAGEVYYLVSNSAEAPSDSEGGWILAKSGGATADLTTGEYYIHIRDSLGHTASSAPLEVTVNDVTAVAIDSDTVYLAPGAVKTLDVSVEVIGQPDSTLVWSSSDQSVASVEGGLVTGLSAGEVTIRATAINGIEAEAKVVVSDLITRPNYVSSSKPMLRSGVFDEQQAALLDEMLFSRVAEAGEATRAGVVAAARFLTLEFPYRVPYFFENGRLSPHAGRPYCDGEGRYYHRGLYLTESKFDTLDPDGIRWGPATWGQLLSSWETKYAFVAGNRYPNGLDCSGFVCWVLRNGGFDFGDMGAGNEYGNNDVCDLGEQVRITTELLQSDRIQVGDLIYSDGHMAIIIGLTEDRIYIAESLFTSVRVTNFRRDMSVVYSNLYTHVSLMDGEYEAKGNGRGNVTDIWEGYEG